MNVSSPLWDSPKQNSTPSTNQTANPLSSMASVSTQPARLIKLYGEALTNTSSELVESPTTTSGASYPTVTVDTGFSQSQTDEIVAAVARAASGNYLWTFKSFWYIAVIVTALTIIVPLVAGGKFRVLLRFSYNYQHYWHFAVLVIILAVPIVLDLFIPPLVFTLIFALPQWLFCLWQLLKAHFTRKQRKRWTVYATLLIFCVGIDLLPQNTMRVAQVTYFGYNIGITGFLPPLYLFIFWIQPTSSVFSKGGVTALVERLTPEVIKNWDPSRVYTKHPKVFSSCTFVLLEALNACLSTYVPEGVYLPPVLLPFIFYGGDKVMYGFQKGRWLSLMIWFGLFGVLAASAMLILYTPIKVIGPVVLFPSLYILIVKWLKTRYDRRHRGAEA
jgi:hypothetical protein